MFDYIQKCDDVLTDLSRSIYLYGHEVKVGGKTTKEIINVHKTFNLGELLSHRYDEEEYDIEFKNSENSLDDVYKILVKDLTSRQAIIYNKSNTEAPACNSFFQFLYRNDRLNIFCYLRSSDVTRLKNDLISIAHMTKKLSGRLDVDLGEMYVTIASLHEYV